MEINKIYNGDCLEVIRQIPDNFIDMVITSPPYDNLRDYNGYSFDFEGIAKELYRILKVGGIIVWIVNDATINGSETGTSFKQALYFKDIGFNLHDTMIWSKPTFTATGALKYRYAQTFEYMFIISKNKPKTFNPIKDRICKYYGKKFSGTVRQKDGSTKPISGLGKLYSEYAQRFNVWQTNTIGGRERTGHPAQFPIKLINDHIISWSNKNDIILDPFVGSGTTCISALQNNRNFIGIEISKEYCELAQKRINDWFDKKE